MISRKIGFAVFTVLAVSLLVGVSHVAAQGNLASPAMWLSQQQQPQPAQEQSFVGQIAKGEDGKFVLQTGNQTYQLDNQREAAQFEGQQVKVTGTLDANSNTITVKTIERAQ